MMLLLLLQTGTDAIFSQHTANTNADSLSWHGKLLRPQKHLEEGDVPEGGKRKLLVVSGQLSTLPPKLVSSLPLWVQGREAARSASPPAPCSQAGPHHLGHWVRLCCEKNNCLSFIMSSWISLLTLPSGIQTMFNVHVDFFFLTSITMQFNLAVNCALVLAWTKTRITQAKWYSHLHLFKTVSK